MSDPSIITRAYETYRFSLTKYFSSRLDDREAARDLVQDVFVRLLECDRVINGESLKSFIHTIARNILNDHLRRLYVRADYVRQTVRTSSCHDDSTENGIIARDLGRMERRITVSLPPQRKMAYVLHRFGGLPARDIARRMNVSDRTAENHIYTATRTVRAFMKMCC